MVKKRGLTAIVIFVFVLAVLNIYLFFNQSQNSYSKISGKFVEDIPELPFGLSISLVAFVLQWILLILIVVFAYARFLKHRKEEEAHSHFNIINKKTTKATTDLDTLYNLLKKRKMLSIRTVSTLFDIDKEKALEWGKILENHGLVTIEYPAFNDPEIRIDNSKEKNEKENEKEKTNQTKNKEKKEDQKKRKGKKTSLKKRTIKKK